MKKKGSAHLEIIISFILFIGFVIFLLNNLQPYKRDVIQDSNLERLKTNFFENASIELTVTLVKNLTNIVCKPQWLEEPSIWYGKENGFYEVVSASELEKNINPCDSKTDYENSQPKKELILSKKALDNLKISYETNYEQLKSQLGLPASFEFSVNATGYTLEKNTPPQNVPIYAIVEKRNIIHSDGTTQIKEFTFTIW